MLQIGKFFAEKCGHTLENALSHLQFLQDEICDLEPQIYAIAGKRLAKYDQSDRPLNGCDPNFLKFLIRRCEQNWSRPARISASSELSEQSRLLTPNAASV